MTGDAGFSASTSDLEVADLVRRSLIDRFLAPRDREPAGLA
jgi:hypothetical protein